MIPYATMSRMLVGFQVMLCLAALLSAARGGPIDQKIDAYIQGEMKARRIAGLSIAVVKDGRVVKAQGYGFANAETRTEATPDTVYQIGSVSKQFLASAILLLQQDGKLTLDDKVSRHIDGTPASWKDMTIRQLLNHSAGLPLDPPDFEPFKETADSVTVDRLLKVPLLFPPGDNFAYSNVAYFVVAEVVRKASGMPWDKFLTDRVFSPLGMSATRTTTTTAIVPNRADGYTSEGGALKNAEHWVALRPSGAFLSTVLDMARWDVALDSHRIVDAPSREQMWKPLRLNNGTTIPYGLGSSLSPWQGHKHVFHDGGMPGFGAEFERFVDDRLTVIVLLNTEGGDAGKIARTIAGFYFQNAGAGKTPAPVGPAIASGAPPKAHNRAMRTLAQDGRDVVRLDERDGNGIAWWPRLTLADGTIEFDVRGKDVPQKSFVGVAFHGADEATYDAVYFRPFNFRAADEDRRSHAVQYISLPGYDWQKLRTGHPGKYEKPIASPPDPDRWFHARVVIAFPKVSVFVYGATEPSLVVDQLSDRKSGWVGFWVGNGSGGDFANLKITASQESPKKIKS